MEPKYWSETIEIGLPLAPSTNQVYRHRAVGKRSMMYMTAKGKQFKEDVKMICEGHGIQPIEGWVSVSIWVYFDRRGADLANREKLVMDALQGYAFVDDKWVAELHMHKRYAKGAPSMWVEVSPSEYTE
jgi:Holliday junction resolvase RusA-like endonuclease